MWSVLTFSRSSKIFRRETFGEKETKRFARWVSRWGVSRESEINKSLEQTSRSKIEQVAVRYQQQKQCSLRCSNAALVYSHKRFFTLLLSARWIVCFRPKEEHSPKVVKLKAENGIRMRAIKRQKRCRQSLFHVFISSRSVKGALSMFNGNEWRSTRRTSRRSSFPFAIFSPLCFGSEKSFLLFRAEWSGWKKRKL